MTIGADQRRETPVRSTGADRVFRSAVAAVSICLSVAPGWAQERGDIARGRALAEQTCARCHSLQRNAASSNPDAPPFAIVADVPGMTSLALVVSLQGAHQKMPNLVLDSQEMADVIAFILSYRRSN
jgi:mono/diheme cytochrome c family protein